METFENNSSKTLDELNHEETIRDIPLLAFLIALSLTGISGNALVFYIFVKTYKVSTFRMFVLFLSAVDLFTCVFAIALDIVILIIAYNSIEWLCKLWTFFVLWPLMTSTFLLLAIATDRYRKVCKPLSWQVSCRAARNMFVSSASLSIGCSVLNPVLYGIRPSKHNVYNVTIFECEVTEGMAKTPLPLINSTILAFIFIVAFTGITVLYCCIAVRVKQQMKRKHQMFGRLVNPGKGKDVADVSKKMADIKEDNNKGLYDETNACNNTPASVSSDKLREQKKETMVKDDDLKDTKLAPKSNLSKRYKQMSSNRTTLVMFMVSSVYFISYVPGVSFDLSRAFFKESLTDFERSVYKFVYRSFLLNSVINSFIYGIFDPHFRNSCKMLCSCRYT